MTRILISFLFYFSISLTALAENQAKVIELILDASGSMNANATRFQLKCIAGAIGGSYFDAENADQLTKALDIAAVSGLKKVEQKKKGWFPANQKSGCERT